MEQIIKEKRPGTLETHGISCWLEEPKMEKEEAAKTAEEFIRNVKTNIGRQ